VLLSADYKTLELRILAALTGDEELVRIFAEGADPHMEAAVAAGGDRDLGKLVNYAICYGAQAAGIVESFRKSGHLLSEEDAEVLLAQHFSRFSGVAAWQEEVIAEASDHAVTGLGRRRYLGADARPQQRLNSPLQMTAADGFKLALVELHAQLPSVGAHLLLPVHDEVLIETPCGTEDALGELVAEIMTQSMSRAVGSSVPFEVTVKSGLDWSEAS